MYCMYCLEHGLRIQFFISEERIGLKEKPQTIGEEDDSEDNTTLQGSSSGRTAMTTSRKVNSLRQR